MRLVTRATQDCEHEPDSDPFGLARWPNRRIDTEYLSHTDKISQEVAVIAGDFDNQGIGANVEPLR